MRPFLYDFKRSFLRLSTLLFLALFIVAGVGLASLAGQALSSTTSYKYSYVGYVTYNGTEYKIVGLAIGPFGNPQPGVKATLEMVVNGKTEEFSATANSSGEFYIEANSSQLPSAINLVLEEANGKSVTIGLDQLIGTLPINTTFSYDSPYSLAVVSPTTPSVSAISFVPTNYYQNGTVKVYVATTVAGELYYNLLAPKPLNSTSRSSTSAIGGIGFTLSGYKFVKVFPKDRLVGYVGPGIYSFLLYVGNLSKPYDYLELNLSVSGNQVFTGVPISSSSQVQSTSFILLISELPSSIFAEFFPIIFLYLAYSLLAKPIDSNALEFLLSRPITRGRVLTSRYLGGVITAFATSGLFVLATTLATLYLVNVALPPTYALLLFLGLSLSLVGFYSLMVMIATLVRGSGKFLGLSIFTYLFFIAIEGVIALVLTLEGVNALSYLPYFSYQIPLASAVNAIEQSVGLPTSMYVNLPLEVVATALWIAIPTLVSYLSFTQYFKRRKLLSMPS